MGCIVAIIAFFLPRLAIILLWLFSTFITQPFAAISSPMSWLWPILGFIFAPYTLLAYCLTINQNGSASGMWLILIGIAVLFDLGVIGGGAKQRKVIVKRKG